MKKINLIVIGIVFVASVMFISIFGMKFVIVNGTTPVTKIECTNKSDAHSVVKEDESGKVIIVKFTTPGEVSSSGSATGTILYISHRVYPDNATVKKVQYIYNRELTRVTMMTDEKGNELGLMLFSGPCYFTLKIMSTDGTSVFDTVDIWVRV